MSGLFDLFSGGKYARELKELQQRAEKEPNNSRLSVRIGDLLLRLGKKEEALKIYRDASDQYAKGGFLIQAIAVNKLILKNDPSQVQIHQDLAKLYAERGMQAEEKAEQKAGGEEEGKGRAEFPVIPLFSDMKQDELSRVMEKIEAKHFKKGAVICKEGEAGDSIYIISHGKVQVSRRKPEGAEMALNELQPGDFFGEFGFFSETGRQATVQAMEDTDVLELSKKNVQEIIREFPGISDILWKFYKERVLYNLLAASSLFRTLSPPEWKEIINKVAVEEFPAGALVLKEGTLGDSMYIIKKGEVEVFTEHPSGPVVSLARLREGDFFGEISFATGRPRTASVKVLQPAELVRLTKKDFEQILANHSEVKDLIDQTIRLRLENKLKALGVVQNSLAKEKMV